MADPRRVEDLFHQALERPARERKRFLECTCGQDLELLQEVLDLLSFAGDEGSVFLETPAIQEEARRISLKAQTLGGDAPFAPYRIKRMVAIGGSGVVYEAFDPRRGLTVALKTLMPDFGADRTRVRRLQREAKSIRALEHPGIPAIYEVGEKDGIHYIAMEWVEGRTLARKLQEEAPLDPSQIRTLTLEIADALSTAHRKGLIHRDLKPSNLMITPSMRIKILDFGLVKSKTGTLSDVSVESLTAEGTAVGTLYYMSPEQIVAGDVDARSDLFSLGVMMYEMATGRRPHEGRTAPETMNKILNDRPVPVAYFDREASDALEEIIQKCLAKDRKDRYQSAEELMRALRGDPPSPLRDALARLHRGLVRIPCLRTFTPRRKKRGTP